MKKLLFCPFVLLCAVMIQPQVKNRDKPARGEWDFKLEKVWEIESAGEDVFGRPLTLRVSDQGIVYVFDPANRCNYTFDKDGRFITTFAREGQGPGEIVGQDFTHLVGDRVIIPARNGTSVFTKHGEYVESIPRETMKRDPRIFIDSENIISAPMTAVMQPGAKAEIIHTNIQTGEEAVIADFTPTKAGIAADSSDVIDIIVIGLSPLMTLGHEGGLIYWGMSSSYEINVSDLEGRRITSFSISRRPQKISQRRKEQYFKNSGLPPEMLSRIVRSFPDEMTHFHRIEVHNGLVYVYVPDLDLELGRPKIKQIDIFSREGEYLYRAYTDFGEGLIPLFSPLGNFVIKDGHIYAVCERGDDTIVILKFKAALPGT